MDMTNIMLSTLFGTVGMGFVMYGKKAGELLPVGIGIALMICPYFITNAILMLGICSTLTALPFVLRSA